MEKKNKDILYNLIMVILSNNPRNVSCEYLQGLHDMHAICSEYYKLIENRDFKNVISEKNIFKVQHDDMEVILNTVFINLNN